MVKLPPCWSKDETHKTQSQSINLILAILYFRKTLDQQKAEHRTLNLCSTVLKTLNPLSSTPTNALSS